MAFLIEIYTNLHVSNLTFGEAWILLRHWLVVATAFHPTICVGIRSNLVKAQPLRCQDVTDANVGKILVLLRENRSRSDPGNVVGSNSLKVEFTAVSRTEQR